MFQCVLHIDYPLKKKASSLPIKHAKGVSLDVRCPDFRNGFASQNVPTLQLDCGFLTFTSLAFEQNLRKKERREEKNEEEKQNKSKAAFLVIPTSPRPHVKRTGPLMISIRSDPLGHWKYIVPTESARVHMQKVIRYRILQIIGWGGPPTPILSGFWNKS